MKFFDLFRSKAPTPEVNEKHLWVLEAHEIDPSRPISPDTTLPFELPKHQPEKPQSVVVLAPLEATYGVDEVKLMKRFRAAADPTAGNNYYWWCRYQVREMLGMRKLVRVGLLPCGVYEHEVPCENCTCQETNVSVSV